MNWNIHHAQVTASTNDDAVAGVHGDVFTAGFQTCGRGRLDHRWLSPPSENLMMSAVLSVDGVAPDEVVTFPLVAGLAVCRALRRWKAETLLKWPNDVLVNGRKLAGILCRLNGDKVIAGIGVNVCQKDFPPEISSGAESLARVSRLKADTPEERAAAVAAVRDGVLDELGKLYGRWRECGFRTIHPEIAAIDLLKGRYVSVRQTDDGADAVSGVCGGILADGSLGVGGGRVYAGEAHVENFS